MLFLNIEDLSVFIEKPCTPPMFGVFFYFSLLPIPPLLKKPKAIGLQLG